jgi:O-antigen/teichoic acid export membrane protein
LIVLLFVILANSTWYTLGSVLAATNRHKRLAAIYLLGTTAALFAAIPLSAAFGLPGAAIALLAIDIVMLAYVLPAALRVVGDAPLQFLRVLFDVPGAVRLALSSVRSSL